MSQDQPEYQIQMKKPLGWICHTNAHTTIASLTWIAKSFAVFYNPDRPTLARVKNDMMDIGFLEDAWDPRKSLFELATSFDFINVCPKTSPLPYHLKEQFFAGHIWYILRND